MLILTRKSNESVIIGSNIEIKILEIRGDQVSIGFSAPRNISIHRKEIFEAIQQENLQAVSKDSQGLNAISNLLEQHFKVTNTGKTDKERGDAGNLTM